MVALPRLGAARLATAMTLAMLLQQQPVSSQPVATPSENIYGEALVTCDRQGYHAANPQFADPNYPTTGYFRDGQCTASSGDAGAHFVCVLMPNGTTASGEVYSTFWTETGQAASPEQAVSWPKPGPWCICMWAFARMFSQHPDFIDMLTCEATNQWTIENYDLSKSAQASALHAICNKCAVVNNPASDKALAAKCQAAHAQLGTEAPPWGQRRQLGEGGEEAEACSSDATASSPSP
jgi:uncharacterized protein (DUF2237 family)